MKLYLHLWKVFFILFAAAAFGQSPLLKAQIEDFSNRTGATVSINKATGSPGFLRMPVNNPMILPGKDGPEKALWFLKDYGSVFGISRENDEFQVRSADNDRYGLEHITLQQFYQGVPVYDGILKFHFDMRRQLHSVNGNYVGRIIVDPVPQISAETAGNYALRAVTAQLLNVPHSATPLKVAGSSLYIFRKGLVQGVPGPHHLAYQVEVRNEADVREFLWIDAHTGALIEQFTGMHGIERRLYQSSYNPAAPAVNLIWKEGDPMPGLLNTPWKESAVVSAGHVYNFFKNAFGFDSYDNNGAALIAIHQATGMSCPNASWNGVTTNFCDQMAADDIVAHEWAHAYTEYTSGLVYAWQPGAINEGFSDIWGETIDILNGYMDEGESDAPRTACGSSSRWQLGEKAVATAGAVRDMWNPNCFGQPGRVRDPLYHCFDFDVGGVHVNSGIPNHAYALLVDGGTYNNQEIEGIGLTKAAHIFWQAQRNYLTQTSGFVTLADALMAACESLILSGENLPSLIINSETGEVSGDVITSHDAEQLHKVILAVELREGDQCGFSPLFEAVAPFCAGASPEMAIFYEDFEAGLGEWVVTSEGAGNWTPREWALAENVYGRSGKVAFADDGDPGICSVDAYQWGTLRLESPDIPLNGAPGPYVLAFDHLVALEDSWSGGNVKYSLNNGADWQIVPDIAFLANGYNRPANTGGLNPLAGQRVFSAGNTGSVTSDWGTSMIDLSALGVLPGATIRFRWELGRSYCLGVDGWYLDDVRVFSCAVTPAVHFAESNSDVNEAAASAPGDDCLGYVDKNILVQIDQAPSQPVVVTFAVEEESTALQGETSDFTIFPSAVTLQEGELSKAVTVRVYNDAYLEGNETVVLSYSLLTNGGDAYAGPDRQVHTLTIADDDTAPGNYTNVLLDSRFNAGRDGWVVRNGGNSNHSWVNTRFSGSNYLDPSGIGLFMTYGFVQGYVGYTFDEILESPAISTLGHKNLQLSFSHYFLIWSAGINEQGTVEVWDGNSWHVLTTYCQSGCGAGSGTRGDWTAPENVVLDIPEAYVNAGMKVRFRYIAANDNLWAIDNVLLTSSNSTDIQTAVNSGDADHQYLGPHETAAFYDPSTGNLMAKITNLTDHDYGCTTVEIDRAGIDQTAWFGSYQITNKTFKVTPTHPKADGEYEITLYYKASELPNFNGEAVKSMGKSTDGIGAGNTGPTSWAEVHHAAAFTADHAFTATFDSGFSGFGLSDAPPVGSLPVQLVNFEGRRTVEGNLLEWTTASESSNAYFVVEHSPDTKDFRETGRVMGKGNSTVLQQYTYLDPEPENVINYYRLRQVDDDGRYTHSPIIAIQGAQSSLLVFGPNPVGSTLKIRLNDSREKEVSLKVLDLLGREVFSGDHLRLLDGAVETNLGHLSSGVYTVIVSGGTARHVLAIVKE